MTGLSLTNDIVFKIVFGSEKGLPVLRALLNALLELSGENRIAELKILNPQLDRERLLQKGVVLDVSARDGQRRQYNIEVQVSQQPAYTERALYYLTRLFSSQLDVGEPYARLAKTIGISLLDFELFPDLEDLHSMYRLYDQGHGRELSDILELHFIELYKVRSDKPQELRTPFERWLHVLKFGELYEAEQSPVPEALAREEGIEMALDGLRRARASDEVRELIEMRLKASHEWASQMEQAEREGLEKGRQEGRQEGHREKQLEVAQRMRRAGMTTETIAQITGLTPEELDKGT